MGIKNYRDWKFEKRLAESELISSLLRKIDELEKKIALSNEPKPVFTADEEKKIKMAQDAKTKPEDFISMFSGEIEEFNPNA